MSAPAPAPLPGWRRAVLGAAALGLAFVVGSSPGRAAPEAVAGPAAAGARGQAAATGPVVRIEGEVARPGWYELGAAASGAGALARVEGAAQRLGLVGTARAATGGPAGIGEGEEGPVGAGGVGEEGPVGAGGVGEGERDALGALARAVADAGGAPLHGANGVPHDGDVVVVRGGWALLVRADPGELRVAGPAGDPRVDLNHASLAELEALPRVGPVLAARIVEGRPYRRLADLDRVKGVGPATLTQLGPLVRW